MSVYTYMFSTSVYLSFYLAFLLGDRHLPAFPFAKPEVNKKLEGSILNRLRKQGLMPISDPGFPHMICSACSLLLLSFCLAYFLTLKIEALHFWENKLNNSNQNKSVLQIEISLIPQWCNSWPTIIHAGSVPGPTTRRHITENSTLSTYCCDESKMLYVLYVRICTVF
jgi:hypothetical protein